MLDQSIKAIMRVCLVIETPDDLYDVHPGEEVTAMYIKSPLSELV